MVSYPADTADFQITIDEAAADSYRLRAVYSARMPAAAAQVPCATIAELKSLASALISGERFDEVSLRRLGKLNFSILFAGEIRDAYRSTQAALSPRGRLRILLEVVPRDLRSLPWEVIYDPWLDGFTGDVDNTTLARYAPSPRSPAAEADPSPETRGVRILVIASQPSDLPSLKVDREIELLKAVAEADIRKDWITFDFRGADLQAIQGGLAERPDVIHFIGHAGVRDGSPGIFLTNEKGHSLHASRPWLESQVLFPNRDRLQRLRLLVLNACETSFTPEGGELDSLAEQLAPWAGTVVAMQYPISDTSSRLFSTALYGSLSRSQPIDVAVNEARRLIRTGDPENQRDWVTPVLVSTGSSFEINKQLNPFKGPYPYETADQFWFRGRKSELRSLLELIASYPVTIAAGPTCCGKTSLLLAGLLPELQRTRPVVYASLSANLEDQLRDQIDKYLLEQGSPPLGVTPLSEASPSFPPDLVVILDRGEGIDFADKAARRTVIALAEWAVSSTKRGDSGRLIVGLRQEKNLPIPQFWQGLTPDLPASTLWIETLSRERMANTIVEISESSPVRFSAGAIGRILSDLDYDDDPNMLAVQAVCRSLYRYAREKSLSTLEPEALNDPALEGVSGVLRGSLDINYRLSSPAYKGGGLARRVLAQLLRSRPGYARRLPEDLLLLRVGEPRGDVLQVVDQLLEDGFLSLEVERGERFYELSHESLAAQVERFPEADPALRALEEIVESAGNGLLPARGSKGCLADLSAARDSGRLVVSPDQKKLLVRSALEAGYESPLWIEYAADPDLVLDVLSDPNLGSSARVRAAGSLEAFASAGGPSSARAVRALLDLAFEDPEPDVRSTAARSAARTVSPSDLGQRLQALERGPDHRILESLALMYESSGGILVSLPGEIRRKTARTLLHLRRYEVLSVLLSSAAVGALGFAAVAIYNWYRHVLSSSFATSVEWAALLPLTLLAYFLALPGSGLAAFGGSLASIFYGSRRWLSRFLGAAAGGALGAALSLFAITSLAQLSGGSALDFTPAAAGLIFGAAAAAGASLPSFWKTRFTAFPLAWQRAALGALFGAAACFFVEQIFLWWPDATFILTPKTNAELWVVGGTLGFFIGLAVARLDDMQAG